MSGSPARSLGTRVPIVQAPIGSATCPALAAAVSSAGGLGMLALTWQTPAQCRAAIRETQSLTKAMFGANLVLRWSQEERLAICLDAGVPIISLSWGDPAPYVQQIHRSGAKVMHTVGSAEEARRARDAGVDILLAQGWEAGGHVCSTVSTMVLVPAVVDAVPDTPVVAAGGIADGRGIAAVLALGAAAAALGTRFLASSEANAHPSWVEAIVRSAETDTVLCELFDGGWPDAPHRVLCNRAVQDWQAAGRPASGSRPDEGVVVAHRPDGEPVIAYSDMPPVAGITGGVERLPQYAGLTAGLVRRVEPAARIVDELVREATRVLGGLPRAI